MTRAMNTLILTRAHYRRRYGNDAPEVSMPSRFLEEVPSQLIENLGGRPQTSGWATPGYPKSYGRGQGNTGDFGDRHYNYEDENQEVQRSSAGPIGRGLAATARSGPAKPFVASWMTAKKVGSPMSSPPGPNVKERGAEAMSEEPNSIDNIARFFGGAAAAGKPGTLPRPAMDIPRQAAHPA